LDNAKLVELGAWYLNKLRRLKVCKVDDLELLGMPLVENRVFLRHYAIKLLLLRVFYFKAVHSLGPLIIVTFPLHKELPAEKASVCRYERQVTFEKLCASNSRRLMLERDRFEI